MCGIIITNTSENIDLIKHRGLYCKTVNQNGMLLSHHRLPIQSAGHDKYDQPLKINDEGWLMFNGEIFNYPPDFKNDTEYLKWIFQRFTMDKIMELANDWDGFWAITYIVGNTIYCFTDPLGKKQLYYNEIGEICSEIRPLINLFSKVDEQYRGQIYKFGYSISDRTPWTNIRRILPNKLHTFQFGQLIKVSKDYFDWTKPVQGDLYDLLKESIQRRLLSHSLPIGCLISGGLDSSIIAWILEHLRFKVNYYSIENGEREYVDMLAADLGINYTYLDVDPVDRKEAFRYNETPVDLGSVEQQHALFAAIPEKIVLSGDGADELFGGYQRINDYDSQRSDIFDELTHYHLPKLDRASMRYTIELRSPFLSHDIIRYALKLPLAQRTNKEILKREFSEWIPNEIINRPKLPLKNKNIIKDKLEYRYETIKEFYDENL